MSNSDRAWQIFGRDDPYYGVLTDPIYRAAAQSGPVRQEFFEAGERYVDSLFRAIRSSLASEFSPSRALDFGCGVGRLAIPLARRCSVVVGVDISLGMLAEAAKNVAQAGLQNLIFAMSDDRLSEVDGPFDFVHSYIVFQHIPIARGEAILKQLIERLRPGGVAALHFTYANDRSAFKQWLNKARATAPPVHALANLLQGRPWLTPLMEMNLYNLNKLAATLQNAGCHEVQMKFSDHGGTQGVMLMFVKRASALL